MELVFCFRLCLFHFHWIVPLCASDYGFDSDSIASEIPALKFCIFLPFFTFLEILLSNPFPLLLPLSFPLFSPGLLSPICPTNFMSRPWLDLGLKRSHSRDCSQNSHFSFYFTEQNVQSSSQKRYGVKRILSVVFSRVENVRTGLLFNSYHKNSI